MKKFLSVFLVLVLCISLFTVANVSATENTLDVVMGTASGKVGDTVNLTLSLTNNPGFGCLAVKVSYDKNKLELQTVTKTTLPAPFVNDATDSPKGTVPYLISWRDKTPDDPSQLNPDTTYTGTLATFSFKILDAATAGEQIPVTLQIFNAFKNDIDMTDVPATATNGYVSVDCTNHTPAAEWTVTKAATCTEAGTRVKYCTVCGAVAVTETIAATGHNYGEWTVVTAATCTQAGTERRVCQNDSSHVETRSIPATGHNYGEWTVVTPATCTEAGTERRVCQNDSSHVETRSIPATGHNFGEWTVATPATCTEDGTEQRVCQNDPSHVETRSIPATGHNVTEWVVDTEATVESEGSKHGTCTVCGETVTQVIPKRVVVVKTSDNRVTVEAVDDISFAGDATLTVDDVTSTIPAADLQNLNTSVGEMAEGKSIAVVFDIKLTADGQQLTNLGGKVRVKIAIPDSIKNKFTDFGVIYIANDNTISLIENVTVENGYIIFETDHFSNYAIIGTAVKSDDNDDDNSGTPSDSSKPSNDNPQNGEPATAAAALALLMVAFAGVVVFRKKARA